MKIARPEKYALPLRTRKDITAFLLSEDSWKQRVYGERYMFCFNVKLNNRLDISYENLLRIAREANDDDARFKDQAYLAACEINFVDLYGDLQASTGAPELYEIALENARNLFLDQPYILFSGKDAKLKFCFEGRSGGWMCISEFEGHKLDGEEAITGLDFQALRRLYEAVVQLGADFGRGRGAEDSVEFYAADYFFFNICGQVPYKEQKVEA